MENITKLVIEMNLGGAAFGEDDYSKRIELARILTRIARSIESGAQPGKVMDINGNSVGTIEYREEN